MKIKIINPDYGMTAEELAERVDILRSVVRPDTVLDMVCLQKHQVIIDSALDIILAGAEIVELAMLAEQTGFDAVVLYCFSDPALMACREAVHIPVFGAGQCALLAAVNLGYHFGLLTTGAARIPEKKMFVYGTGVSPERLAAVISIDMDMQSVRDDQEAAIERLVRAAGEAVSAGAQVIVLGCLSFLGMASAVSERLGVPVIDPAMMAVATAEMMVAQRLQVSKLAYPEPPEGYRQWPAGALTI